MSSKGAERAYMVPVAVIAISLAVGGSLAFGEVRPRIHRDIPASATHGPGPQAHNSPTIAADPTNSRFMALANRVDAQDYGCALQLSGNGGRGWVGSNPIPKLPSGAEKCYAPEVAFDARGRLYFLFVGLAGPGNVPMGAFLTTTEDRGRSFSPPRRVLGPRSFQVRMAIDTSPRGDRLHLVWIAASEDLGVGSMPPPPNPILAKYSDDGGKTFSRAVRVNDPARSRVMAPALTVGEAGKVHILYYDLGDDLLDYHGLEGPTWEGRWTLALSTSTNRGRRFSSHSVVSVEIAPAQRVMLIFTMPPATIVADGRGGLIAAWPDARRGDPDILFGRSPDGWKSWSRPKRINDDTPSGGSFQDLPRLSTAPNGRIDAIFYDRRNDSNNRKNEVFYAESFDRARSFGPNLRLTGKPSDSTIGKKYGNKASVGLTEFGSRLGLHSGNRRVVAAWSDTRSSYHPLQQDIFSTTITLPK